jgi:hydroxymethylpyrimidine/phosphomethylpyrimidine kinase
MAVTLPCALAVGGLDPGGGAGVVADLRAFAAAGAFGCAAVAVITAQSTAGLRSAHAVGARELEAQVREVMDHQRVRVVKVGALGSAANVRALGRALARWPGVPVVVDTPMRPSRGKGRLLAKDAVAALREQLLPRATLATVNLDEALALTGEVVRTVGDARDAALRIAALGPRAVLVKGGHMRGPSAVDVLAVDGDVVELRLRRLAIPPTHGTGCTLASLVAGRLAHARAGALSARTLIEAVRWGRRVHRRALARPADVGRGMRVLVFRQVV